MHQRKFDNHYLCNPLGKQAQLPREYNQVSNSPACRAWARAIISFALCKW